MSACSVYMYGRHEIDGSVEGEQTSRSSVANFDPHATLYARTVVKFHVKMIIKKILLKIYAPCFHFFWAYFDCEGYGFWMNNSGPFKNVLKTDLKYVH